MFFLHAGGYADILHNKKETTRVKDKQNLCFFI